MKVLFKQHKENIQIVVGFIACMVIGYFIGVNHALDVSTALRF